VAVTFDDAFLSARQAVERLLDAGVPATIFVATGHVGGTNAWNGQPDAGIPIAPLMGWQDLEDLRARGAEMAPHTRRHRRLTAVTDGQLDEELLGSLDDLQQRLGTASPHFAYPYGDVDDRVARRTARHFQWAHTADFRPLSAEDSPHRLPRLDMYYFKQPGALDSWGTQRFRHRLAVTRARRWVRAQVVG
jgi:peptidoglycan/xylan/chitin deacetylase (PgdA/CDA1 family)